MRKTTFCSIIVPLLIVFHMGVVLVSGQGVSNVLTDHFNNVLIASGDPIMPGPPPPPPPPPLHEVSSGSNALIASGDPIMPGPPPPPPPPPLQSSFAA